MGLPEKIEFAIYGLVVTPALHLADRRGIFASLLADGPATGPEVATRAGLDPDTTERVLLVLASVDIVRRDADGRYTVAAEARPFVDPATPDHVGGFVQHLVDGSPTRLATLDRYLTDGAIDGEPSPYARFYADAESTGDFMRAMWDLSHGVSRELAALAGLAGHRRLVDVGGANGPFAVAALAAAPDLTAVVFDLPDVAPHLARTRQAYGLGDRLTFIAGDFFRDDLPTGDVLAFGYVMSNWPDDACRELVRKAYRACAPGGKLLVMDRLLNDGRDGPLSAAVMNLTMRLETHGRHRTAAEFVDLLTSVGWTNCAVRRSSRDKHLVIGHKPDQR
ncbi:MAG TPA: methyltransferase [Pseudonocardiaceae bacterium]|nr:methyltransferase [Pseudonocardiaceae bacterium]